MFFDKHKWKVNLAKKLSENVFGKHHVLVQSRQFNHIPSNGHGTLFSINQLHASQSKCTPNVVSLRSHADINLYQHFECERAVLRASGCLSG